MYNPLVTVFVPMYNSEKFIDQALESIINQTYSNLEILIIDDGSTDKSSEIVNAYNDNRIILIENGENKGIPYTRNRGLQKAKGKYIAIMDADDIAYLERIEKQVRFMEENSDIDVLGTFYKKFGNTNEKVIRSKFIKSEEIKVRLLFYNNIANPTTMLRTRTIREYGINYDHRYFVAQDYHMWIQFSKIGNFHILPEVLLKYRSGHSNITKSSKKNKALQRQKLINSARRDILEYYGFNLTDNEIKIFCSLFAELSTTNENINKCSIIDLLSKLVEQNKEFSPKTFTDILYSSTITALGNSSIKLRKKMSIYKDAANALNESVSIKHLMYLIIKHIQ